MSASASRPRRSCLYMPASNARALEKAKTLAADTIIFDLEDAVAPEAKSEARAQACAAVTSGAYGPRELVVRINGMDTEWFADDVQQVCASGAAAILVPKIQSAADIATLTERMVKANAKGPTRLWAMIEMPLAVLNIGEIAQPMPNTAGFPLSLWVSTTSPRKCAPNRIVRCSRRPWRRR